MTGAVPGASHWESTLFDMLRKHVDAEQGVEEAYQELAAGTGAPDVRYLIQLILEDEQRHHRWFGELASSVQAMATGDRETPIPWIGHLENGETLLAATRRFLQVEREDARSLRELKRALKDVEETTLWALLVRIMLLDTKRHIEILRFIARRARAG